MTTLHIVLDKYLEALVTSTKPSISLLSAGSWSGQGYGTINTLKSTSMCTFHSYITKASRHFFFSQHDELSDRW